MSSTSTNSAVPPSCPECQGTVATVGNETFCQHCGRVFGDCPARPSRTAQYGADDEANRGGRRVGPSGTATRHDRGLSTDLKREHTDAHGSTLSASQQHRTVRLERTQRWFGTDSTDRRLREGLTELRRLVEALELPDSVHEDAAECYRSAKNEDMLRGRSIESVAGACVYIAGQRAQTPRTYDDLETVSRVEIDRVKRAVLSLQKSLDIGIAKLSPQDYVGRVVAHVDVPPTVETDAINILDEMPEDQLHSGTSLIGWAAAAVYLAARQSDTAIRQEDLSETAGISKRTIQKRLREFEKDQQDSD